MSNPWVIIGVMAAWGGSVGVAGWWAYGAGQAAELVAQARDDRTAERTRAVAAEAAASAIASIKVRHTTIQNEVQREIIERPTVYGDPDCRHSPEQLRRLNAALTGRPEPAGGGELPASDATR